VLTTRKIYLILVFLLVAVLVLSGCGVPQEEHEVIKSQLASTQQKYAALQNEHETVRNECETSQSEAQSEIERLQAETTSQSATLEETRSSSNALQKTVSELEDRVNAILDTEVVKYYLFPFQYRPHTWIFPIPLGTYFHYKDQPRLTESSEYSLMVTDPYADSLINVLVNLVKDEALAYDLKKTDAVNLVTALVQNMVHTNQDIRTPYDEYRRYPIETLFEEGGDCEDNSILVAALLTRLDYKVVLFIFEQPQHIAIGVDITVAGGHYWEYQAKRYYYLETTGDDWEIGDCPNMYKDMQPIIILVGK